jgi:uncharacterized ferritin-like protein (DUF455 family)
MNNIFDFAEACLCRVDIDEKLVLSKQAWQLYQQDKLSFTANSAVKDMSAVKFPEKPELLAPRFMPHRKLGSKEGMQAFYHSLAHIEFVAIYLAWDMLYRFRDMPKQFYIDWLQVAYEETLHFEMIREHLRSLGLEYGDLPAHKGLWEHAQETDYDVLARLTIIPRCMEARGLDVTPMMIKKLANFNDEAGVKILTRIYEDEKTHVQFGSHWFNHQCQTQKINPEETFKHYLLKHYNQGKPKGPFNREVRLQVGFTKNEMDWLEG